MVGLVPKTKAPVPVSSVTAEIRFADEGVARNVATPVPRPDTPVEIGSPVTFVITPDAGVPRAGADIDGLVRVLLVSVSVVALPTKVSVDVGNVSVPVLTILAITGVVRVGLVAKTLAPVPVSSVRTPAS